MMVDRDLFTIGLHMIEYRLNTLLDNNSWCSTEKVIEVKLHEDTMGELSIYFSIHQYNHYNNSDVHQKAF